jgi:hypothetical protein
MSLTRVFNNKAALYNGLPFGVGFTFLYFITASGTDLSTNSVDKIDLDGNYITDQSFPVNAGSDAGFDISYSKVKDLFYAANRNTLRKIDKTGQVISTISPGGGIRGVAVDAIGDIYVGTLQDSPNLRKYNSSGTLLWSVNPANGVNRIAISSQNEVYISCAGIGKLEKIDPSNGSSIWTKTGFNPWSVFIDNSDNVYSFSTDNLLRKYDPSGTLLWSFDHGASELGFNGIAVDSLNNVYVGSIRNNNIASTFASFRKLDTNGNLIWSRDTGAAVAALTIYEDFLYVSTQGATTADVGNIRKYDLDGTLIWTTNLDDARACRRIAVDKPVLQVYK